MQIDQYIRTILFFTVNIKNPLFWVSAKHVCFLNVAFMAWLYLFSSWLFRGFNTTFFSRTCVHVCYYSFMFHLFIWNRFASRIEGGTCWLCPKPLTYYDTDWLWPPPSFLCCWYVTVFEKCIWFKQNWNMAQRLWALYFVCLQDFPNNRFQVEVLDNMTVFLNWP